MKFEMTTCHVPAVHSVPFVLSCLCASAADSKPKIQPLKLPLNIPDFLTLLKAAKSNLNLLKTPGRGVGLGLLRSLSSVAAIRFGTLRNPAVTFRTPQNAPPGGGFSFLSRTFFLRVCG